MAVNVIFYRTPIMRQVFSFKRRILCSEVLPAELSRASLMGEDAGDVEAEFILSARYGEMEEVRAEAKFESLQHVTIHYHIASLPGLFYISKRRCEDELGGQHTLREPITRKVTQYLVRDGELDRGWKVFVFVCGSTLYRDP